MSKRSLSPEMNESSNLVGKSLFVVDKISCSSSRTNVAKYQALIRSFGAVDADSVDDADLVLVDTCAFNKFQEDLSLKIIQQNQKRIRTNATIIVCGCLAAINPKRLEEQYGGKFFSPKNESHLRDFLGLKKLENETMAYSAQGRHMGVSLQTQRPVFSVILRVVRALHRLDTITPLGRLPLIGQILASSQAANPNAYAITISQGCLGNCSFCVIPMAKGKTVSAPVGEIVEKVREIVGQGTKKIILTSEDVGAYGKDNHSSLVDLLNRIIEIPGDYSLYLQHFDPRWLGAMKEELRAIMASGRIAYIQFPIQSGSPTVLARMRRAYDIEKVVPVIDELRREFSRVTFSTQIIVGFPGETNDDYVLTKTLMSKRLFDWVQVFEFSDRPGAATNAMSEHVGTTAVANRASALRRHWFLQRYFNFRALASAFLIRAS